MPLILFSVDDQGIANLTLNRPNARNALNFDAIDAFMQRVKEMAAMPDLRALIITGAGKAFCAGGDLKEHQQIGDRSGGAHLAASMGDALNVMEALPVITIAAINGPARGGGAELAMACDLRLIAEEASIAFVHATLGLIPGWGGGERLRRAVGTARALEYISTAQVLSPDEALAHGLVNAVYPGGQLIEEAEKLAAKIAQNSRESVATIKRLFQEYQSLSPTEARLKEREAFIDLWDRDERREMFKKFLDE